MESNGSPDTIQREFLVFKGDVIATVPDPDLEIRGEGRAVIQTLRKWGLGLVLHLRSLYVSTLSLKTTKFGLKFSNSFVESTTRHYDN